MSRLEFSHPIKLDRIGAGAETMQLSAGADECAALAKRFDLIALTRLEADLTVQREGEDVLVQGAFSASLAQACVVSGEAVTDELNEALFMRFVPAISTSPDAEIELSDQDCDIVEYEGGAIDLGEAIAQSLALALNPYPRSAGADAALKAAGVKSEEEAGPFAGLSALKENFRRN